MSIESKRAYRFDFLKSEEWQNARIAALARTNGRCQICKVRDLGNDGHHVYYPDNFWDTKPQDIVILCRPCHELIHVLMEKVKGRGNCFKQFRTIVDALKTWTITIGRKRLKNLTVKKFVNFPPERTPKPKHKVSTDICTCCRTTDGPFALLFFGRESYFWNLCLDCHEAIGKCQDMKSRREAFKSISLTRRAVVLKGELDGAGSASN